MGLARHLLGVAAVALAAGLLCAQAATAADGRDAAAVRRAEQKRAEQTVERLRADLAKVNADVAALKRADRSLRNDYRLRERMADAEALAQKLTASEAVLSAQVGRARPAAAGAPVVASPQASPQDGSVELEAKADLLADQARKLDGEADVLAKAADQLRSRKALRRKAGSWDRDPFAGLETSRRNVVASAAALTAGRGPASSDSGRTTTSGGATPSTTTEVTGTAAVPPPVALVPSYTSDSAGKGPTIAAAADGAAAAKSSVLAPSGLADRQAVEQRLFLDPATAAELRHALGAGGAALDPDALERGVATLRARARALASQARSLRDRSRAP